MSAFEGRRPAHVKELPAAQKAWENHVIRTMLRTKKPLVRDQAREDVAFLVAILIVDVTAAYEPWSIIATQTRVEETAVLAEPGETGENVWEPISLHEL